MLGGTHSAQLWTQKADLAARSRSIEKKSKIVRRGKEKERKLWTTERSALTGEMAAIITTIVGVGGVNFPTVVVITAMKGMDTMEMLAMTGGTSKASCLKIVKAQGQQRSTGEGRRACRTTAMKADARPVITLVMDTPGSRQMLHQTIR